MKWRRSTEPVDKPEDEWRSQLTEEQYEVLRNGATERPFTGKYVDSHEPGVYRCAACGNELFDSGTKFDSGTGWPSFTDVLREGNVELRSDHSLLMERTEVVCASCGSHLGHVFDDGPAPTNKRYCINSVALDLTPTENSDSTT